MKVSVVVCTYTMDRRERSRPDVRPLEVVLVIDGNPEVYGHVVDEFGDHENVIVHDNDENAVFHTVGRKEPSWPPVRLWRLLTTMGLPRSIGLNSMSKPIGRQTPLPLVATSLLTGWAKSLSSFLKEFYWLVGCTERGFAEDGAGDSERYGSNVSYKREVFLDVGWL